MKISEIQTGFFGRKDRALCILNRYVLNTNTGLSYYV